MWGALDVVAKLENDGTLRISERHRMRFDGDWNGGQREFRVAPGQELSFAGMSRVEADGVTRPMAEARGEGINLHEYRMAGQTLRWRAREASDPPFRNEERIYVIAYSLRNIVERKPEHYVLDHDFAIPDRTGVIESLSVKLELDSAWQAPAGFVPQFERTNVPPGDSAILTVQLQWTGEGQPQFLASAVPVNTTPAAPTTAAPMTPPAPPVPPVSLLSKLAALAAFLLVGAGLTTLFLRREKALGRFAPTPQVTPEWLEEHLLAHRAEVVGVAWDGATGPGEVAALIAIMTAEGKIENLPGAPKLRLLVPRESLSDYERGFVNALFIQGDEIDPETLRLHYRETGFQPAKSIAAPLSAAAVKLVGNQKTVSWAVGCVGFVLALFVFPIMAIGFALTLVAAARYRSSLARPGLAAAIPLPLLLAALFHTYIHVSLGWLTANLIAGAFLFAVALRLASWRGSREELRRLLDFLAARNFLRQRIVQRDPEVDPRWIPYMLAFGLVPDDRWSVAAASRPQNMHFDTSNARHGYSSPASPKGVPAPVFTPAGGAFGGAGATGSWASIQTFASTVAATPTRSASSSSSSSGSGWSWSSSGSSSSSSSRSSSSSSSRSGGGGGGGW